MKIISSNVCWYAAISNRYRTLLLYPPLRWKQLTYSWRWLNIYAVVSSHHWCTLHDILCTNWCMCTNNKKDCSSHI